MPGARDWGIGGCVCVGRDNNKQMPETNSQRYIFNASNEIAIGHPVVEPLRLGHLVGQDQGNEGTGVGAALLELAEARLAEVARKPPDIEVVDLLVNGHGDRSLVARGSTGASLILCPAAS